MGFTNVLVEMEPLGSSWTVRSRKFMDLSGGSTSQVRSPNLRRVFHEGREGGQCDAWGQVC